MKLDANPVKPPTEIDFEQVVTAIRRTGEFAIRMKKSGLSEVAIVVLLNEATGVGRPAIRSILAALPKLPEWCLVKQKPKL